MKLLLRFFASSVFLFACSGGDGEGGDNVFDGDGGGGAGQVDVVGDSPEVAAEEIAEAICEFLTDCPAYAVICSQGDAGTKCTATEGERVSRFECNAELRPSIYADLLCADLTSDQEQLVNACVNGTIDQGCPTREFYEERAEAIEAGEEPKLFEAAECRQVEELFAACEEE